jgi:hypothetical protein
MAAGAARSGSRGSRRTAPSTRRRAVPSRSATATARAVAAASPGSWCAGRRPCDRASSCWRTSRSSSTGDRSARTAMPCPERRGDTFLDGSDGCATSATCRMAPAARLRLRRPTTRKRLFVIARCDGEQIVWPEPTHGPGLLPYRTAAECIDWSICCARASSIASGHSPTRRWRGSRAACAATSSTPPSHSSCPARSRRPSSNRMGRASRPSSSRSQAPRILDIHAAARDGHGRRNQARARLGLPGQALRRARGPGSARRRDQSDTVTARDLLSCAASARARTSRRQRPSPLVGRTWPRSAPSS